MEMASLNMWEMGIVSLCQQTKEQKKTYFNVPDRIWNEIKSKYPELPEEVKSRVYSDGTEMYIEIKKKKMPLDGKCVLKILNEKK